jgi:hypothetical protein
MNRKYLLDSLDGMKVLIFRLLGPEITGSIAYVPMTTDGPWTNAEKTVFERAIGIPHEQTYWSPGGFVNVPLSSDPDARSKWVDSISAISHPYLFLDPDIGFYTHHNGESDKKILINELALILRSRKALIVYRHQYWPNPKPDKIPDNVHPYVWHGLRMLRTAGFAAIAYQSQTASFFFISLQEVGIEPFRVGLRHSFSGLSAAVVERRLVV